MCPHCERLGYSVCPCFRCRELAHHLATWLFGTYHSSMPIAVYIAACARADYPVRDGFDDRLYRQRHIRRVRLSSTPRTRSSRSYSATQGASCGSRTRPDSKTRRLRRGADLLLETGFSGDQVE